MYTRLYSFIKKYNILVKNQYGFQRGKSTDFALLDLQSKILHAYENNLPCCTILLDFAKAFDTVNHQILLSKLEHYGIRGNALNWLKSYLSNRQQCVQIGESLSEFQTVKHGVPQGSILGPLLFLLYINDIVEASEKLQFLLFADDTSLFYAHKDIKVIEKVYNEELQHISNWLCANKLSLNVKKSKVLLYRPNNRKQHSNMEENIELKIDGANLEEVASAKYLGMLTTN